MLTETAQYSELRASIEEASKKRDDERLFTLLAGYIRRSIDDGAFRPVNPLLAAEAFFGIIAHHRLMHDIFGLPMHLSHEATVAEYVSLFLCGLIRLSPDTNVRR